MEKIESTDREQDGVLKAPKIADNVPANAQWLGGIGAGSWFHISQSDRLAIGHFNISRYRSDGELEFNHIFLTEQHGFDLEKPYQFTYTSHGLKCTLVQEGKKYIFTKTG